jgi:hypothetical protein
MAAWPGWRNWQTRWDNSHSELKWLSNAGRSASSLVFVAAAVADFVAKVPESDEAEYYTEERIYWMFASNVRSCPQAHSEPEDR